MIKEYPLSEYLNKFIELDNEHKNHTNIAFLSSFTINGLSETVQVKCNEKKIYCDTYAGGYNQFSQEILNLKSKLYDFSPNLTFLILDLRSVLGDLFFFPYSYTEKEKKELINSKLNELFEIITFFVKNSNSKLVLTNFNSPSYSSYGIASMKSNFNLKDMVLYMNKKLQEFTINKNSIFIFDFDAFVSKFGEKNVFNYQNYFFGDIKIDLDYIPYFANELIPYIIAQLGISKKCIVLDLDNTLWGGIVGEDGFDGIKLGPQLPGNTYLEFQKNLKALKNRGIILAINSKNNFNDAIQVINEHPNMILRKEDFSSIMINWNNKVSNMYEIAQELNIGLDSIVFFDDDPVNRELMRTSLPDILTVELPKDSSEYVNTLHELPEFSMFEITDEDSKRSEMYAQQQTRKEFEISTPNLEDLLRNLSLELIIKKSNNFTNPRISQLILKTNQFNLTTKRYTAEEILNFTNDENIIIGCAQVKDKFGDHGITGVFIIKKLNSNEWFLDTFLLSCRIIGREIEKGILNYIINEAKKNGIKIIKSQYVRTEKNTPIQDFLPNCGFKQINNFWEYDLNNAFNMPDFIKIEIE
jgi:FkbH-like protein|tara:strand:+ start:67 stop:1818 length:1752 start_codon:yes stop_codon:yes gene_type:complete